MEEKYPALSRRDVGSFWIEWLLPNPLPVAAKKIF